MPREFLGFSVLPYFLAGDVSSVFSMVFREYWGIQMVVEILMKIVK